ncbi:MAG: RNA methyltransferase [Nitrososphaerota archaeon]|jgi:TrmH family RNA methyltransferase|nr:RNA methyltransferase [Nitrososphaerota archaeon]MDG6932819.1 RNA methyltransferase [Nitrososphaerota archaeon]MDG6935503.1 RNA methyltransferase [Nitrososphaerota archaeon]MDG6944239.1 RNA methyltransferase [Nitrososphaerota archaeon]
MKSNISVMMVEPTYAINIGYVARTMKNFGVNDLILTGIRKIPKRAYKFASHATDVLENAKILKFEEALNLFDYRVATSARADKNWRTVLRRSHDPEISLVSAAKHKNVLLILGRDTTGLTNEEIIQCDDLIKIPTSKAYSAMNISHSLAVLLYLWNKINSVSTVKKQKISRKEIDVLIDYVQAIAEELDMERPRTYRAVRLFRELSLNCINDEKDIMTLLGFFSNIKLGIKGYHGSKALSTST